MIRSEYYSENDQEPVGQVSVTKYSTDPRDLDQDGSIAVDGKVSSVTTTQKFGYKDTPSLKSLTDKKKVTYNLNRNVNVCCLQALTFCKLYKMALKLPQKLEFKIQAPFIVFLVLIYRVQHLT